MKKAIALLALTIVQYNTLWMRERVGESEQK